MEIARAVPNIRTDRPAETRDFFVNVLGFEVVMDIGWIVTVAARNRAAHQPRIEFSDVSFGPPGQHPRTEYRYAFGVRLTNLGGGPARHLNWGFIDEDGQWFAEMVQPRRLVTWSQHRRLVRNSRAGARR